MTDERVGAKELALIIEMGTSPPVWAQRIARDLQDARAEIERLRVIEQAAFQFVVADEDGQERFDALAAALAVVERPASFD